MGVAGQEKVSWQTEDLPFKIVILLLEFFSKSIRTYLATSFTMHWQKRSVQ
jgi:hypothetical protein